MVREKRSMGRRFGSILLAVLATPLVLLVILPLALIAIILYFLNRLAVCLLVWTLCLPQGKDVLMVLSESPIWHDYMSSEILPLVRERTVILNWSRRTKWPRLSFAAHVFRTFRGERNSNPLVVVFRPFRGAEVFRFWQAFWDWKHRHRESVERLKQRLLATL